MPATAPEDEWFVPVKGNSGALPPQVEDNWTHERIVEEVRTWTFETSLASEAWAANFARNQKDPVRKQMYCRWVNDNVSKARKMARKDLSHLGGIQELLEHFKKSAPEKVYHQERVFASWEDFQRMDKEPLGKFVDRARMVLDDMAANGFEFVRQQEAFSVIWLIRRARLDESTRRMMMDAAGSDMKLDKVMAEMRRYFAADTTKGPAAKVADGDPEPLTTEQLIQKAVQESLKGPLKEIKDMSALVGKGKGKGKGGPDNRTAAQKAKAKAARLEKLAKIQCRVCSEWGHYADQCPSREKKGGRVAESSSFWMAGLMAGLDECPPCSVDPATSSSANVGNGVDQSWFDLLSDDELDVDVYPRPG